MAYLYRQRINLMDLAGIDSRRKLVLIAEPEEYLLALYSFYLNSDQFDVRHCTQIDELERAVGENPPHILVFNPLLCASVVEAVLKLIELKRRHPALPVVTIGYNLSGEELKRLMSAGIVSHLERRLTRPKDLVILLKTILKI